MSRPDILKRCAFRWLLNGEVILHGYSQFSMDYICNTNDFVVVEKVDEDNAFVRKMTTLEKVEKDNPELVRLFLMKHRDEEGE